MYSTVNPNRAHHDLEAKKRERDRENIRIDHATGVLRLVDELAVVKTNEDWLAVSKDVRNYALLDYATYDKNKNKRLKAEAQCRDIRSKLIELYSEVGEVLVDTLLDLASKLYYEQHRGRFSRFVQALTGDDTQSSRDLDDRLDELRQTLSNMTQKFQPPPPPPPPPANRWTRQRTW